MREQPGQTPPERCHPCPVPARSPWLPRRPCPPLPAPGPKYPGRCGRCPLPFSGQNQTHVDVRPRGSLGNGLAWCFPNRVPWNLSIPCGHPWRPGVAAAGPSAGQAPPDTASRSPLSSRFSFVAALAPPSRFLFGPLPTTPLRLLPVLWSPPPPPASFGMPGSASGRRRQRLSQWPEPCPGSSRDSGAEACGTPETGQCGGSAAAGTLGGLPFAGGRRRCPHEPVAWLGPVGAWGLEGGVRPSLHPALGTPH